MTTKKKIRVSRLQTASDIKRELARLYAAGRREELPPVSAYRLSLVLRTLLHAIEVTDIELADD